MSIYSVPTRRISRQDHYGKRSVLRVGQLRFAWSPPEWVVATSLCQSTGRYPLPPWDLICDCWAKVEWGYGRILVRDGANAGWINYMLKDRQKSDFDGFVDCIIIESLHNPIADA